jgi:hypothetical protein
MITQVPLGKFRINICVVGKVGGRYHIVISRSTQLLYDVFIFKYFNAELVVSPIDRLYTWFSLARLLSQSEAT